MPKKQVETANVDITRKGIWVYGKDGYYNVCNFGLKILYRIQNGYGVAPLAGAWIETLLN